MTEPDVASSDATNISCSIRKEGRNYVVNGRKWWISGMSMGYTLNGLVITYGIGAGDPRCKIAITLVRSEGSEKTRLVKKELGG
jgi:acyl-CoA dehydrogenase